jgi:hypothetical protein
MNNNIIINHSDKTYTINKTDDESYEIYLERINYIKNKLNDNLDIDHIIKLSLIWRNVKFYKMGYPCSIMKQIKS